jgi:nucleotide-binding universal stress UspA family protein
MNRITMRFRNILVPYDGSSYSNRAFDMAIDLAQKYNSKLTVVSCIHLFTTEWFKTPYENAIIKKMKGVIAKDIADLKYVAKKNNISIHSHIIETSSIVKTLVSFSKTKKIDLIVMGTHGKTGLDKLILGSVANGVVHHVNCPVLLVK